MVEVVFLRYSQLTFCPSFYFVSSAFVAKASTTALSAAKGPGIMAAVSGAVPAILSSTAAVATEGTNEWFGVDDTRLLGVLFLVHWLILSLWIKEYGNLTDTDNDFFGEIDYTMVKKK